MFRLVSAIDVASTTLRRPGAAVAMARPGRADRARRRAGRASTPARARSRRRSAVRRSRPGPAGRPAAARLLGHARSTRGPRVPRDENDSVPSEVWVSTAKSGPGSRSPAPALHCRGQQPATAAPARFSAMTRILIVLAPQPCSSRSSARLVGVEARSWTRRRPRRPPPPAPVRRDQSGAHPSGHSIRFGSGDPGDFIRHAVVFSQRSGRPSRRSCGPSVPGGRRVANPPGRDDELASLVPGFHRAAQRGTRWSCRARRKPRARPALSRTSAAFSPGRLIMVSPTAASTHLEPAASRFERRPSSPSARAARPPGGSSCPALSRRPYDRCHDPA